MKPDAFALDVTIEPNTVQSVTVVMRGKPQPKAK
jgi:hypothetical protein